MNASRVLLADDFVATATLHRWQFLRVGNVLDGGVTTGTEIGSMDGTGVNLGVNIQ